MPQELIVGTLLARLDEDTVFAIAAGLAAPLKADNVEITLFDAAGNFVGSILSVDPVFENFRHGTEKLANNVLVKGNRRRINLWLFAP